MFNKNKHESIGLRDLWLETAITLDEATPKTLVDKDLGKKLHELAVKVKSARGAIADMLK